VFLLKTDFSGNIQWMKSYSTGLPQATGNSVKQTSDGGYVVAGTYGANDFLLMKTNSFGGISWSKSYGGANEDFASCVIQTTDGGYAFTGGSAGGIYAGETDVALVKTDPNGNMVWVKKYGGGVTKDVGNSIEQANDGSYIIAGTTLDLSLSSSFSSGYVIKTNSAGDSVWTKVYGKANTFSYNSITMRSIHQTRDQGYIIVGDGALADPPDDIVLIKTDNIGNSGCNELSLNTVLTTTGVSSGPDYTITVANLQPEIVDSTFFSRPAITQETLHCNNVVVPLTLINLSATVVQKNILITWQTTQEINTKHFIIERSADAINFSAIGNMNAQNSPAITHSYNYTDNTILPRINFYRLRMVDKDGSFTFSGIIRISAGNQDEISISSNPVSNYTTISFSVLQKQKIFIGIYDIAGRLVKIIVNAPLEPGTHQLYWNSRDEIGRAVSAGMYVLKMRKAAHTETKKFIVVL
jgi:hypothetical protein